MRALRLLLKILLVLVAIVLAPVLVWWIYNRFDEAPTAAAARLAEPFVHSAADRDNAWLQLVGLGAADGEDPIALGRRRADAFNERAARALAPGMTAHEKALYDDAVPVKSAALCRPREQNCVEWAAQNSAVIATLRADNALRQQRFEATLRMPAFDELYTPRLDTPDVGLVDDAIRRSLIAGDFAAGGDLATALSAIEAGARFWHRVDALATSDGMKVLAHACGENHWRLAHDVLEHATAAQLRALKASTDAILEPLSHDFDNALKYQFQLFDNSMRDYMARVSNPIHCVRSEPERGCFKEFLVVQAFEPQATMNIRAAMNALERRIYAADAPALDATLAEANTDFERFMPLGDYERSRDLILYNGAGKVLASISVPKTDWPARFHDREALRRMFAIELDARRAGLDARAIPAFLAAQPRELRNPYTGEPFDWDAQKREVSFAPRAEYWKKPRLQVAIPLGPTGSEPRPKTAVPKSRARRGGTTG